MYVAARIIIGWPSTAASIPAGWSRETSLDGCYIIGAPTSGDGDLVTGRGSATHTHTSPAHVPIQVAHTHDFEALSGSAIGTHASVFLTTLPVTATGLHGHALDSTNAETAVNDGVSITVDAASNDPPYTTVIWLKSDGSPSALPAGAVAFFASDILPAGWSRVFGDTYLKGASTGADGGSTGGSATHTHTSPPHTHTQQSHTHSSYQGTASATLGSRKNTTSSAAAPVQSHVHTTSADATTATNQPVTTTLSTTNHEPPYKKLNVIQASALDIPVNIIALWGGTAATIPPSWIRYTGMDGLFHKAASVDGESGVTTGGSTQHTHTASDCQPTQDAHTHVLLDLGVFGSSTSTASSGTASYADYSHTHTWTVYDTTAANNPVSVTVDNCSVGAAYPSHRRLIFIYWDGSEPPPPGPTVSISGQTSYEVPQWQSIEGKVLPEVAAKIAHGDRRYFPEAL